MRKNRNLSPLFQRRGSFCEENTHEVRVYGLVNFVFEKKHVRVHQRDNEFVRGYAHINGIESFWGFTKTRLAKLEV